MKKVSNIKSLSFTKLLTLFTIGSLLGWILETSFTFFKYGHYIVKKGMILGVFKPLYGVGIIVFYLVYLLFKNKKWYISLGVGSLVGMIYEYGASLFETYVLHTNTWDYSKFNFNINGRIYLPYILVWGVLYLLIIKVFPYFDRLFDKLKTNKLCNFLIYLLAIFMSFNIVLTTLTFYRYSMRERDIAPKTFIGHTIDYIYTDDYMKKTFPRLRVVK